MLYLVLLIAFMAGVPAPLLFLHYSSTELMTRSRRLSREWVLRLIESTEVFHLLVALFSYAQKLDLEYDYFC